MPAAAVAGISAGSNLLGGWLASRGANQAAQTQVSAANAAGQRIEEAAAQVNPQIAAAGGQAAQNIIDDSNTVARFGLEGAQQANAELAPYLHTGRGAANTLGDMLQIGGSLNRDFSAADLEMDPGYQFRLQEGMKALERSAAARGGALGGAALKEITRYSQGVASQEFGAAFDRFRANRGDRFNMLSTVAGTGLNAANTAGQNTIGGHQYAGNALQTGSQFSNNLQFDSAVRQAGNTLGAAEARANAIVGAGNARAAGQVGSANAWGSALTGAGNNVSQALLLSSLLKKQNP